MKRFSEISLKNKIFFSFLGVTMLLSVTIAFLARWILVSSLTTELELRGIAIARSIAEHGGSLILEKDYPRLLALLVDEAKLRERRYLITYIYVTDQKDNVLSHTFVRPFPRELRGANTLRPDQERTVREVVVGGTAAYDIAVGVYEGLYQIGTVHVGLSKNHMDSLVSKLRNTFLGFITGVVIITFLISHWLSRHITEPVAKLTRISNEVSRGNFEVQIDSMVKDASWDTTQCPAYIDTNLPCWHADEELSAWSQEKPYHCEKCSFYIHRPGDEVVELEDAFRNMFWSIKLYRRRLRESEEKYRSLFDSGPDPIFVVACENYEILDVNPRALELYGYRKPELLGASFRKLGEETNKDYQLFFDEMGEINACVYYQKVLHYKKGGKPFFVNVHACPITYQGRPATIIATADVTEMMEKDAQLIQAAKMKTLGEMSAGVAHEINQPLNAIMLGCEYLELMREQGKDVTQARLSEVTSTIVNQVGRAKEIIDSLRAFGRKSEIFKEQVDVNRSVRGVLTIIRRQFELDNITFHLELAETLPPILAQDNRLQQVIFNLVNNARDAINEKSRDNEAAAREITLRTYADNGLVVAEVADTGQGIPDSVRDKIFEPFFTTKGVGKGTGLGLAISYGIVRDFGGDIHIDSREGGGATFKLSFPAAN